VNKLSKIIAEVWNRANRVFPRITGARILRFLIHSDDGFTLEETDIGSFKVPYPAKWAPDTGQSSSINARWIGGRWGGGTVSSGIVSTSDNILAAQWDNLIDELKTHNHDGTHGKQLVNDSIEDYSLTHDRFVGGTASVFLQPSSSYVEPASNIVKESDPDSETHIPSPTAHLIQPGTAWFVYHPPEVLVPWGSQVNFHFFYGVPTSASGTISYSAKVYQGTSIAWSQSGSFDASTLGSTAAVLSGTCTYLSGRDHNLTFAIERGSDSCSYALLAHGVLVEFKTRP